MPATPPPGAPAYLAPACRYGGDDWTEGNALSFIVYAAPPVLGADGAVVTSGEPQDLTGYTVTGALLYQQRSGCNVPVGMLPAPAGAVIDAAAGTIALSLPATATAGFPRQDFALWGRPERALLLVRPRIVDAGGAAVTVGLQQLFVF